MKTLAIIAIVGALAATYFVMNSSMPVDPMEDMYREYIAEYRKSYSNGEEYEMRFKIFSANVKRNEEHNAGTSSFTLGINQFSDWTNEEYRQMLGYVKPNGEYFCDPTKYTKDFPASIDWTTKGAVNAVQNQGSCGSCWAFGTIGTVEGAHFVATGQLVKFSEQQLVDCCHDTCYGCSGGFQNNAMRYLFTNDLCTEADYPYTGRNGNCNQSKCTHKIHTVNSCHQVNENDADALRAALAIMPISVTVDAGSYAFQAYKGGILDSTACGTNLNHAVLGTGYGTNYFTIKNSWGASWGDKGFIKITSDNSKRAQGICGVLMDNSYPESN